jgi:hypothetical protein
LIDEYVKARKAEHSLLLDIDDDIIWQIAYSMAGDFNGDNQTNNGDVTPFTNLLNSGGTNYGLAANLADNPPYGSP